MCLVKINWSSCPFILASNPPGIPTTLDQSINLNLSWASAGGSPTRGRSVPLFVQCHKPPHCLAVSSVSIQLMPPLGNIVFSSNFQFSCWSFNKWFRVLSLREKRKHQVETYVHILPLNLHVYLCFLRFCIFVSCFNGGCYYLFCQRPVLHLC